MKLFKPKKILPISYPYVLLGTFSILIIFCYFFLDRQTCEWMEDAPNALFQTCHIFNILTQPEVFILGLPLLFFIIRIFTKKESLANLFLFMAITVNATNLLVILIKMFFGRYRPDLWISDQLYGFDFFTLADMQMSFPSGYAGGIASILFSLACVYPKKFPLFLILTFVLSFCRVVLEKHYVSDILGSMLLALFVSQWIYISFKRAKISL